MVVSEFAKLHALDIEEGRFSSVLLSILNHPMDDHIVVITDYWKQVNVFDALDLPYRAVLDTSGSVRNDSIVSFEEDKTRVIDDSTFMSQYKPRTMPTSNIERILNEGETHDPSTDDGRIDEERSITTQSSA